MKLSYIPEPSAAGTRPLSFRDSKTSVIFPAGNVSGQGHRHETNSMRGPTSPPQGLLSPLPRLFILTKSYGGSVRPQPGQWGEHGTGVAAEAWILCTHRKGVLGSQPPKWCWEQRFTLTSRPSSTPPSPLWEKSWDGRPRVEGRALPKMREWKWNGTNRSASVRLGGVDAALGAIHVLSRQLRGHLRGQAVGQGSGGRGHMLLKAVDARLFGGLGAG